MQQKGYERSKAAPCLFKKKTLKGPTFISLYVDNGYIIANKDEINTVKQDIESSFKIKFKDGIHEYVGCTITENNKQILFKQLHLIKKLYDKF